MYISKLFLMMMDLLNLETPLENPGYIPVYIYSYAMIDAS